MVDGWNYFYDVVKNVQDAETGEDLKRYAKFETPVLNISADSSVKLNVSLWGDYASDDLDKEHNYPEYQVNAIAAIVAFNPETGLYEEVERKHFDLDKKAWKNVVRVQQGLRGREDCYLRNRRTERALHRQPQGDTAAEEG